MKLIRRTLALIAATAMAALITLTASACGGATTATSTPTNGLENKSPADVLQHAAAALRGAKSVHFWGTSSSGHADLRFQDGSSNGTVILGGASVKITRIGNDTYINTDQAGLKAMGAPPSLQRVAAGRWLKVPASDFTGLTLADIASGLTARKTPLVPKVRQATLDGRKVVVVSWQDGAKLYIANTGPAYPLRGEYKTRPPVDVINFTEYGVPLHITAPSNAMDITNAG